ncbi:MAG: CDP-alcohol phosphatidyltransferase family protein [Deltaproteobacteria bacterium]|nr:CDP-alcohol phosphatidyltransferase family protein [Deltaproteobacteria bacterium]
MFTLPNCLSIFRMVCAPVLLYLAWIGRADIFLVLLVLALLSDAIDGMIARKYKQETDLGAKLDSWGDFSIYMTVPLCTWWLWPDLIRQEAPFVAAVVASFAIPIFIGFLKYRRLTSYHTWAAKFSAAVLSVATLVMLLFDITWPFEIATVVLALSALEEIAITTTLSEWQSNVRSVWHARKFAREPRMPQ